MAEATEVEGEFAALLHCVVTDSVSIDRSITGVIVVAAVEVVRVLGRWLPTVAVEAADDRSLRREKDQHKTRKICSTYLYKSSKHFTATRKVRVVSRTAISSGGEVARWGGVVERERSASF